GFGMYCECRPLLIGLQVLAPSSVRNAPAAEMAMNIRWGLVGSSTMVWRPKPPAPGCQPGADACWRRAASSCHDLPPSVERNSAASSTPAYTVSGSWSDGSRCHTRLKSHGWSVPSYHLCGVLLPS